MSDQPKPEIGIGATECMHSDRHAYTIIEVSKSGKQFKMQQDQAIRIDNNGMSEDQTYKYEPNPDAPIKEVKLTKYGWRMVSTDWDGHKSTKNGSGVLVGQRSEYYDFSF